MQDLKTVLTMLRATARRCGGRLPLDELLRVCGRCRLDLKALGAVEATLREEGLLAHEETQAADPAAGMPRPRSPRIGDDSGWFLDAARRYPLLSAEREAELFRHLRRGDEARQLLARGEIAEADAAQWIARAEEAQSVLILSNLRLVYWVTRPFFASAPDHQADLLQQGTLGVRRATESFDCERGTKFSTYATWWIWQHVNRYLELNGRTVRLPCNLLDELRRLRRVRARLHGAGPADALLEARVFAKELGITQERVMVLLQLEHDTRSLQAEVDDGGDELWTMVPDDVEPEPSVSFERQELEATLKKCMDDFDERTREVLKLRFGLGGGKEWTLEEVGEVLGVTRERVRQIEAKALDRLRHPVRARRLESFL